MLNPLRVTCLLSKSRQKKITDILSPNEIVEYSCLEGNSGGYLVQSLHAQAELQILGYLGSCSDICWLTVRSLFKGWDSRACLGKLCQCSLICRITRCLLMFIRNLLCFSLLLLIQILSTTENSLILFHFCPCFTDIQWKDPFRDIFSPGWTDPTLSASPHMATVWDYHLPGSLLYQCLTGAEEPRTGHFPTSAE